MSDTSPSPSPSLSTPIFTSTPTAASSYSLPSVTQRDLDEGVEFSDGTSVVMCRPRTGRTHQIRIHLQWLGTPIPNDPLYASYAPSSTPEEDEDTSSSSSLAAAPSSSLQPLAPPLDTLCAHCQRERHYSEDKDSMFIYLHALCYEKAGDWKFQTELPAWSLPPL
eukprot:TRINITY_DN16392_c0_g1_i1.p1 TRINITY_DN16392_c0_g1~~TRINITY_DN16392_c0_g1_i1.p1  ORF type:complete len:165 (-),score=40.31 TRINITY_DN16392_c0_g1_i1:13-507(-)